MKDVLVFLFPSTEDLCVPWRLQEREYATREVLKTNKGWQVTYQCVNNATGERAPRVMSYHYPNTPATFTCKTGNDFQPTNPFMCQGEWAIPENREMKKKINSVFFLSKICIVDKF